MENDDYFQIIETESINNIRIFKDDSIDYNLFEKKDFINKKIDASHLNYNESEEENKSKKKPKKIQNNEYSKMKNRENAKKYRERNKSVYSAMIKENLSLKEELNNILEFLQNNCCPRCKSLNLDKECEHKILKKNF